MMVTKEELETVRFDPVYDINLTAITCASCQTRIVPVPHHIAVGNPEKPVFKKKFYRALYFSYVSNSDFCSVTCMNEYMTRRGLLFINPHIDLNKN